MVGKAPIRIVQLPGGYAQVQQSPVKRHVMQQCQCIMKISLDKCET